MRQGESPGYEWLEGLDTLPQLLSPQRTSLWHSCQLILAVAVAAAAAVAALRRRRLLPQRLEHGAVPCGQPDGPVGLVQEHHLRAAAEAEAGPESRVDMRVRVAALGERGRRRGAASDGLAGDKP